MESVAAGPPGRRDCVFSKINLENVCSICYCWGVVRRLRAFSLFSGAGGLDLGVETAAYRVEFAIENDPVAVATLNLNREKYFPRLPEVSALDITKLEPRLLIQS